MRKLIVLCIIAIMVFSGTAYGVQSRLDRVFDDTNTNSTVSKQSTIYSAAYRIGAVSTYAVWTKLTTPNPGKGLHIPKITITCEYSYDETASNFASPTTLEATHSIQYVIRNRTSTFPTIRQMTPTTMKYMRFKVTGSSSNTTGTTIRMYLFSQGAH